MKKRISALVLAASLAIAPRAFAQNVDRAEIESVRAQANIVFRSYEGPHAVIDTLKAIKGIGEALGMGLDSGKGRTGEAARYSVIRVIDPSETMGFDADILVLGKNAGVDHIRNLRVIIAGYLEKAFGYSERDALLLAEFITIYNAVYRGNWNYFASKYKPKVIDNLEPETAGLALGYEEWPGRTKMLIPLSNPVKGSLSAVSTGSLTEPAVVNELKKAEDKGVERRQEMVDLKEREVKQGQEKIDAEKAKLEEDKANLAKEKAKLEETKRKLEETKKAEAEKPKETEKTATEKATTEEKPKEAEKAAIVAETEKEVAKKEEEIAKAEKAIENRDAKLAEAVENVALKEAEVKTEREAIRSDQGEKIKEENFPNAAKPPEKPGRTIIVLQAHSLTSPFASLAAIDLGLQKIKNTSKLNTIRARTLVETKSGYFAVAGTTEGQGAVRLVSIDPSSLETRAMGVNDLFIDSFLMNEGEELYAVLAAGGAFYLGRFGPDLVKTGQSDQSVHPYTALVFAEEGLIVQGPEGAFYVLSRDKLEAGKRIE